MTRDQPLSTHAHLPHTSSSTSPVRPADRLQNVIATPLRLQMVYQRKPGTSHLDSLDLGGQYLSAASRLDPCHDINSWT
jgi:hypothetical protein